MSLDGFVTGPYPTAEQPLCIGGGDVIGSGGERWMVDEAFAAAGAVVAGRRTYDHTHGWGEDPPFKMPVFVPTHPPREVRTAGATTFMFVPDVKSAVAQAKAVAGDRNVHIMGGASTADQALQLGLVDQFNLHIEPVLSAVEPGCSPMWAVPKSGSSGPDLSKDRELPMFSTASCDNRSCEARTATRIVINAPIDSVKAWLYRQLGRLEATDDGRTRLVGTTDEPHRYARHLTAIEAPSRVMSSRAARRGSRHRPPPDPSWLN